MVAQVRIELTSLDFQSNAKTTSATMPFGVGTIRS